MFNIAIRTDGGANIGMGHIIRCLALAEELSNNNCNVTFITKNNEASITKIKECGFDVKIIDNISIEQEVKYMIQLLKQFDILITDSYEIDYNYLNTIKRTGIFLVSIDDLNKHDFPCDIVINGNIYAEDLNYKDVTGKTRFLLGSKYVLVRKEFRNLLKKQIKDKAENVLITTGGSDPRGVTLKILQAVVNKKDLKINVVIGPSFNRELIERIERFITCNKNISAYYNANANVMKELMIRADIAISAGGSTLYELAAAGVPTIVFIAADNQVLNVNKWVSKGAMLRIDNVNDIDNLRDNVNKLLLNKNMRNAMSNICHKLVDGFGVIRCTEEIYKYYKKIKSKKH